MVDGTRAKSEDGIGDVTVKVGDAVHGRHRCLGSMAKLGADRGPNKLQAEYAAGTSYWCHAEQVQACEERTICAECGVPHKFGGHRTPKMRRCGRGGRESGGRGLGRMAQRGSLLMKHWSTTVGCTEEAQGGRRLLIKLEQDFLPLGCRVMRRDIRARWTGNVVEDLHSSQGMGRRSRGSGISEVVDAVVEVEKFSNVMGRSKRTSSCWMDVVPLCSERHPHVFATCVPIVRTCRFALRRRAVAWFVLAEAFC